MVSHPSNAHAQGVCTSGYTELSEAPIKDVLGNHLGILAVCEKVVGSQALLEGVVKGDHIETEIDVTMTEVDVDPEVALGSSSAIDSDEAVLQLSADIVYGSQVNTEGQIASGADVGIVTVTTTA